MGDDQDDTDEKHKDAHAQERKEEDSDEGQDRPKTSSYASISVRPIASPSRRAGRFVHNDINMA
jgi:hypothetical protein